MVQVRYPVDSTEAREMREAAAEAEHLCIDGWLDEDDWQGRPHPCPRCRPHLRRQQGEDGLTGWTSRPTPSRRRHKVTLGG